MVLGVLATAAIVLALPAVMKNQHHDSTVLPSNSPTQSVARLEPRDLNGKINIIPPKGFPVFSGGKKVGNGGTAVEVARLGNFRKWVAIWTGKKGFLRIIIYSGEISILHVLTENYLASSLSQTHPVAMPRGEAVARNKKVDGDRHQSLVWQVEPGLIISVEGENISQEMAVIVATGVSISP
jgi:hypothetical protein